MTTNKIINLYEYYKDTPKKLKIVCDWDEVIQAHEPYAKHLAIWENPETKTIEEEKNKLEDFFCKHFETFWTEEPPFIYYSPFGSRINKEMIEMIFDKEFSFYGNIFNNFEEYKKVLERQQEIKNSPDFYQKAPFLSIAEDLKKLIEEKKVEKLIFLSAYDKRKFPNSDQRKAKIISEAFFNLCKNNECDFSFCLIGFDSDNQGSNKADWIKENASNFDVLIDDNPHICRSVLENVPNLTVFAPFYPAIRKQHHEDVILLKNTVSDLKIGNGEEETNGSSERINDCV